VRNTPRVESDGLRCQLAYGHPRGGDRQQRYGKQVTEIEPHQARCNLGCVSQQMVVVGPYTGNEHITYCIAEPCRPKGEESQERWGHGGTQVQYQHLMRTANTPSEKALRRSEVALRSIPAYSFRVVALRSIWARRRRCREPSRPWQLTLTSGAPSSWAKKFTDVRGNVRSVGFQRKMPRIEEPDDGVRNIAPERLGAGRQEERIVLPPYREEWRFVGPEIVLENGCYVGANIIPVMLRPYLCCAPRSDFRTYRSAAFS
jgi:hypothetical protein